MKTKIFERLLQREACHQGDTFSAEEGLIIIRVTTGRRKAPTPTKIIAIHKHLSPFGEENLTNTNNLGRGGYYPPAKTKKKTNFPTANN